MSLTESEAELVYCETYSNEEAGQLSCELDELRQLLHESHERENMVEEEAETAKNEVGNLRKELKTLQGREIEGPKVTLEQL